MAEYEKLFRTRKQELIAQGLSEDNAEFALASAKLLFEQLKWDVKQYEEFKKSGD